MQQFFSFHLQVNRDSWTISFHSSSEHRAFHIQEVVGGCSKIHSEANNFSLLPRLWRQSQSLECAERRLWGLRVAKCRSEVPHQPLLPLRLKWNSSSLPECRLRRFNGLHGEESTDDQQTVSNNARYRKYLVQHHTAMPTGWIRGMLKHLLYGSRRHD